MADPRQISPARVVQVGPDRVTLVGEEAIIEAKHPMPDWDVREINPVPIYLQDRKFLLARKSKASLPFSTRYHLLPWPDGHISSPTRFHTYDAETVAERDSLRRGAKLDDFVGLFLFPLYPFIGLLWSGTQSRLTRFGVVPRTATGASIFLVFCLLIVQVFLCIGLVRSSVTLAVGGVVLLLAMLVDVMARYGLYLGNHEWFGGFLEWRMPPTALSPRPLDSGSPGFFAALEGVLWSFEEKIPGPIRQSNGRAINLPPIVERELRVALRKLKPARTRLNAATICVGLTLLLALVGGRSGGHTLHEWLCFLGCISILSVPSRIAGVFATERRDQTLGLLFLSGLNVIEVFLSKTLSAALVAFTDLLAIVPMLALPFLMGGVSFGLFLATVCSLPNLLFFALSVSLLGSVLTEDEGSAVVAAFALAFALCAIPPIAYLAHGFFATNPHPLSWLLRCSPAYGPWLLFHNFGTAQAAEFWHNFGITLGWSFVCLALAALALTRLWRRREELAEGTWMQRWHRLAHGTSASRRSLAAQQLDDSPFAWYAARDRQPATLAWLVAGSTICLWTLCWGLWPAKWPSTANFLLTAMLLNLALRWIIQYAAAAGLAMGRHEGGYELLLTTPLDPDRIVSGQLRALRRHFLAPGLLILGFETILMLAGLFVRPWKTSALVVYFGIWAWLLFWTWLQTMAPRGALLSMWGGLNTGRPATAAWAAFGLKSWGWLWFFYSFRYALSGLRSFPSGSVGEIIMVILGSLFVLPTLLHSRQSNEFLRQRLVSEFRDIVREPLPDPHDPRFKHWKIRERFPWG
jgi:hypothetical protein